MTNIPDLTEEALVDAYTQLIGAIVSRATLDYQFPYEKRHEYNTKIVDIYWRKDIIDFLWGSDLKQWLYLVDIDHKGFIARVAPFLRKGGYKYKRSNAHTVSKLIKVEKEGES